MVIEGVAYSAYYTLREAYLQRVLPLVLYGAGQPKPALNPKFFENPGILNY